MLAYLHIYRVFQKRPKNNTKILPFIQSTDNEMLTGILIETIKIYFQITIKIMFQEVFFWNEKPTILF